MTGPDIDAHSVGSQIYGLIEELFPIHRSQTGEGNRKTFEAITKWIAVNVVETPTGNTAFGWTIPMEWNIRDAYISFRGERIVDYRESNLHIVNGSQPCTVTMNYSNLRKHLFEHEKRPDGIPYRTAFFRDEWGFCVTRSQMELLEQLDGPFDIVIDSSEKSGSLSHAEIKTQPGAQDSILIWAHCCHPSLANDNLSGIATATMLAKKLASMETRYNYHFVFAPATIGAINWLATNHLESFRGGLVLSLLGDSEPFHYKKTPSGKSELDRVFALLAKQNSKQIRQIEFDPFGYDERQFCAPASKLHVGRLTRSLPGEFDEYHSSKDNLDLVNAVNLDESYQLLLNAIEILEANETLINTQGHCEPFLQPYNLYRPYGDDNKFVVRPESVMYVLNLANGKNDLIEIADRSGHDFEDICAAANKLKEIGILQPAGGVS